ncbi:metallophosphoesterase [Tsuneonella deserti]|uniref:Metallophosphoesterase n=1 Tax=Tsuneonella deserti TaxID=2035528 RepID=A0ABQ1SC97_9SPHN|nr:metallophosphoesterase [Tsuneonella deserti]
MLFHLSDIHFGLEHNRSLDWVAGEIAERKPAAVLITGDLTMRARTREFAAARDWILGLQAPVTVEVGNHDLPYFNLFERFFDPYKKFRGMESVVEKELDLPGIAIVPLKTAARMQPRLDWSKGWVSDAALEKCLNAIDALPAGKRVLVTVHHPLVEVGTKGTALTHGGTRALAELARRKVTAVLSGHVHDPFDMTEQTVNGPVRMIGAGTLSQRIRSTPQSFNELRFEPDGRLCVEARNLQDVPTEAMKIEQVPEDAMPPREPGEPVAPVGAVPRTDPPVH